MSERRILQITRELEAEGFLTPVAPEKNEGEDSLEKDTPEFTQENRPQEIAWVFPQEKTPSDLSEQLSDDDLGLNA
jgi:hypothetical protein